MDPYLDSGVAAQVEVELGGVSDANVDCGAGWDVATLANLSKFNQDTNVSRVNILKRKRVTDSRTWSFLSAQNSRVWWRFCTTMNVMPGW